MQRGEALLVFAGLAFAFVLGAAAAYALIGAGVGASKLSTCPHCVDGSIGTVFSPNAGEEILGLIRSANESIDVEMYLFSYRPLADELVKASERGVKVRVILEPRLTDSPNLETMKYLREKGITARWASLTYKLTHAKAMIIDKKKVLVGSTNWSASALGKNREYSVTIEDNNVVDEFVRAFEGDWEKATAEAE
jgi:phosphatidylserine/phosphatidylglycerophosphate/cardiolipin synthase-like enzyme